MFDYELVAVSIMPVAMAFAWMKKPGRLHGIDVVMSVVAFVSGMLFLILMDSGWIGQIFAAFLAVIIILPWALVCLPRSFSFGYDVWSIIDRGAEAGGIPFVYQSASVQDEKVNDSSMHKPSGSGAGTHYVSIVPTQSVRFSGIKQG